jgi:chemotaxis protein MotB
LEDKYADLKKEHNQLTDENQGLTAAKTQLENDLKTNQEELAKVKTERDQLQNELASATLKLKTLQDSYAALEKNSNDALESNMKKNRELLAQLGAKENALAAEQERLNKLQADLKDRSQRVNDLESMIAAKEASMQQLKETLSKALNSFEGKGLSVYQKNGKVYVSMENKLLFQTGSWAVGAEGKKAIVEVGKVLAQNPEISVLIEGHTDNDKILGSIGGGIESNWDLSTKRATAIVTILSDGKGVNKENLTAAGRGEFAPIASNETAEGKAKNRRIEIILTPKLDEISKMLNDL